MAQAEMVPANMVTGEESWRTSSASFRVFSILMPGQSQNEKPLGILAHDKEQPAVQFVSRRKLATGRSDDFGKWAADILNIQDGALLKVVTHRSSETRGARTHRLQVLVRIRATGPLQKLSIALPEGADNGGVSDAHLYSRFDVLTVQQARVFGARIPPKFEHLYTDTFGDVVDLRVIEPETAPMPFTQTVTALDMATGEEAVRLVERRSRARGQL